jgi:hypothetical protein
MKKVEFIKEYKDERGRVFPKGKRTALGNELAEKVIKSKHAKEAKDFNPTQETLKKLEKAGVEIK